MYNYSVEPNQEGVGFEILKHYVIYKFGIIVLFNAANTIKMQL